MVDEPDNLILRQLRAMDLQTHRVLREVQALRLHTVAIENGLVALRQDIQNLDERMARVETRLDLRDAG